MSLEAALETFLEEDGVALVGAGAERMAFCVSPTHDNTNTPAMSVNLPKGLFICHGCGFKGNAYTYLRDVRRLDEADIKELLTNKYGWSPDKVSHATQSKHHFEDKKEIPPPRHVDSIPRVMNKVRKRIKVHPYERPDGLRTCYVARYETVDGIKGAKCLPFTPRKAGGYWAAGPLHDGIPEEDRRADKYQIYNLLEVAEKTSDSNAMPTIWIVEGEKCVDVVREIANVPEDKRPPVCSIYGSKADLTRSDLSVLEGKPVLLIADQDKVGRGTMKSLGAHLNALGCAVNYVLPTGDDTGYDIADVIGEGGWKGVQKWFAKVGITKHRQAKLVGGKVAESIVLPPMADTEAFKVLGLHQNNIVIQSKITHQIHYFRNTTMSSLGTLQVVASASFWQEINQGEGLTNARRESIGDALIRAAEHIGFFGGLENAVGRGALRRDDGAVLFNLGNAVLSEDDEGLMTVKTNLGTTDFGVVMHPGKEITYQDDRQAKQYLRELYVAILEYRFKDNNYGRAYLGWLVTSLIGGALKFRPMLWLLGSPGVGKSFLIDSIGNIFHKGFCYSGKNATSAGLVGSVGSDSLPTMVDEFQMEGGKEDRWRDIMALIRVATNGDGGYTRGTATGGSVTTNIRFSMLLASAYRPEISEADNQRIMPIKFSERGVDDWVETRRDIESCLTPERVAAMRGWIIKNTAKLVRQTDEYEDKFINEGFTTRQAEISAALTVGAGFMSGDYSTVHRQEEVLTYDQTQTLKFVMSSPVQRFGDNSTLAEVLKDGWFDYEGRYVGRRLESGENPRMRQARLDAQKYGLKFMDHSYTLLIAPSTVKMREIVANDAHFTGGFREYLVGLPGAIAKQNGKYFTFSAGGVNVNGIAIPFEVLVEIGFYPPDYTVRDAPAYTPPDPEEGNYHSRDY